MRPPSGDPLVMWAAHDLGSPFHETPSTYIPLRDAPRLALIPTERAFRYFWGNVRVFLPVFDINWRENWFAVLAKNFVLLPIGFFHGCGHLGGMASDYTPFNFEAYRTVLCPSVSVEYRQEIGKCKRASGPVFPLSTRPPFDSGLLLSTNCKSFIKLRTKYNFEFFERIMFINGLIESSLTWLN